MTTAVKVDAHAGWPVMVVIKSGESYQDKTVNTAIVQPNTEQTFYIHSGMQIIAIEELPLPTKAPAAP